MRLGVTFGTLKTDLRAELLRSVELAHGVQDVEHLKRALNAAQHDLYDGYDWPHLYKDFTPIAMAAGQRMYDMPTGLDFDRIVGARVWWNGTPHDIRRGIGTEEYASYDSDSDERTDPPLKFDLRYESSTNAVQMEVWPIPASATATIELHGSQKIAQMVDDSDVCLMDAEAVVLLAAARLETDEKVAQRREARAQQRIRHIRARFPDGDRVKMGHGVVEPGPLAGRAVVRVR